MGEFDIGTERWMVTVSGSELERLRELLVREIESDTAEAQRQDHRDDRASYHRALADMHGLLAAVEGAGEVN